MAFKEKDQQTSFSMRATRLVECPQKSGYTINGEEAIYFTAHIIEDSCIGPNGEDVDFLSLVVDETQPIWLETSFEVNMSNSLKSLGQIVTDPVRIDEEMKGRDYHNLISFLNNEISRDMHTEIAHMPGEDGFKPYFISPEMLVSLYTPELPGVVLVEAA